MITLLWRGGFYVAGAIFCCISDDLHGLLLAFRLFGDLVFSIGSQGSVVDIVAFELLSIIDLCLYLMHFFWLLCWK